MTKSIEEARYYYSLVREDVVSIVPKHTKRILECGCGEGYTGAELKKQIGAEITGIEIFADAAKKAKELLDRVIIGDLDTMHFDFPDGYFDCILFPDVLEHTKNPESVLLKLEKYLAKDGIIIASIPNIQYMPALLKIIGGKFEYEESGVLDKTHLRFFTLHTIEKMFSDCGFWIETIYKNKGQSLKFKLFNILTFGLLKQFSIYQYIVIARKKE